MAINVYQRKYLTKSVILKSVDEEELFRFYLGHDPQESVSYTNPLRVDNNPGCSYYRNKYSGALMFHDFALGRGYTFVDVVMEKFGLSYPNALKKIALDFDIPSYGLGSLTTTKAKRLAKRLKNAKPVERKPPIKKKVEVGFADWDDEALAYWEEHYVSKTTLDDFGVRNLRFVRVDGDLVYSQTSEKPAYHYKFNKGYKMYFPFRKRFRFMGRPVTQMPPAPVFQDPKKPLVLTKAYKDVIVLASFGIEAVAPPSESFIYRDLPAWAKGRRVVVNGDLDPTGIKFMQEHKRLYGWEYFCVNDSEAKDIADFVRAHGPENTEQLLAPLL